MHSSYSLSVFFLKKYVSVQCARPIGHLEVFRMLFLTIEPFTNTLSQRCYQVRYRPSMVNLLGDYCSKFH